MKYLANIIWFNFSIIILIFSLFVKKKKGIYVFGGRNARSFDPNIKYFFDYCYNKNKEVYFFTKDKQLFDTLKIKYSDKIVYSYSIKAIIIFIKSEWIIVTHGIYDLFPFPLFILRKRILNLWHGVALKNIGCLELNNKSDIKKNKIYLFDLFLSSSETEKNTLVKAFKIVENKVVISGIPRNDKLLNVKNTYNNNGTFKVLYAPTFRDDGSLVKCFPFEDFNSNELSEFLIKENIEILYHGHIKEFEAYGSLNLNIDNFTFVKSSIENDIQDLLIDSDALITDYSGIYFDYLLLERPIMFFPYDIEKYKAERGFIYDYDEVTPGPKIKTQKEFIDYLILIKSGFNPYKNQIENIKAKFHNYDLNNSICENILFMIE